MDDATKYRQSMYFTFVPCITRTKNPLAINVNKIHTKRWRQKKEWAIWYPIFFTSEKVGKRLSGEKCRRVFCEMEDRGSDEEDERETGSCIIWGP